MSWCHRFKGVNGDDDVYPRETPPHIRTARASPQRHTAAGTTAPTTADTGNTVPQRANPTQTAYAHPRRRAQAQGKRLGTWTLVRPQKGAATRIVPKGTTARSAPQQSPSQMLGSALASFRPGGRGFIFLLIPCAEGSRLPLPVVSRRAARHIQTCPGLNHPTVGHKQLAAGHQTLAQKRRVRSRADRWRSRSPTSSL